VVQLSAIWADYTHFMKPADIFKLIVKAFGVFLLYQAVSLFTDYLTAVGATEGISWPAFIKIASLVGAAVWFLFGAPPIQRWAYPEAKPSAPVERKKVEAIEEVEGGKPCVSCGKRISHDSKICPFCGWTQPG
jgi:hypothetical protein